MIFGFNTDVKHGDTVYHVQTEAHPANQTFQSTIFVRGQCIGKKSGSFGNALDETMTDEQMHQKLKQQHREVVEAIRDGRLQELLQQATEQAAPSDFL